MAHNLAFNESRQSYSLYSLRDIPWHGLGQIVAEAVEPKEALRLANLDYTVELAPMYASFIPQGLISKTPLEEGGFAIKRETSIFHPKGDDKPAYTGTIVEDFNIPTDYQRVSDIYATYRTDNYAVFGTVGSRYEIVQNEQALDFIFNVIRNNDIINPKDIVIETAGALNKGERIFVTAKLPSSAIKIDGVDDQTDRYIVFTSSHDGSTAVQAMFTNVRVVCNNTLNVALGTTPSIFSFRHTCNVKQYMQEGSVMMAEAIGYNRTLDLILNRALSVKVDDRAIVSFIADIALDKQEHRNLYIDSSLHNVPIDSDIISTRKMNIMHNILSNVYKGVGQDVAKGTMYNLYNGVTTCIANGTEYNNATDRFDSIMRTQGSGYKLAQRAMQNMIRLIA